MRDASLNTQVCTDPNATMTPGQPGSYTWWARGFHGCVPPVLVGAGTAYALVGTTGVVWADLWCVPRSSYPQVLGAGSHLSRLIVVVGPVDSVHKPDRRRWEPHPSVYDGWTATVGNDGLLWTGRRRPQGGSRPPWFAHSETTIHTLVVPRVSTRQVASSSTRSTELSPECGRIERYRRGDGRRLLPVTGSGYHHFPSSAGLVADPVGQLGDLVVDRPALRHQMADLAVCMHDGGVVAASELLADLG